MDHRSEGPVRLPRQLAETLRLAHLRQQRDIVELRDDLVKLPERLQERESLQLLVGMAETKLQRLQSRNLKATVTEKQGLEAMQQRIVVLEYEILAYEKRLKDLLRVAKRQQSVSRRKHVEDVALLHLGLYIKGFMDLPTEDMDRSLQRQSDTLVAYFDFPDDTPVAWCLREDDGGSALLSAFFRLPLGPTTKNRQGSQRAEPEEEDQEETATAQEAKAALARLPKSLARLARRAKTNHTLKAQCQENLPVTGLVYVTSILNPSLYKLVSVQVPATLPQGLSMLGLGFCSPLAGRCRVQEVHSTGWISTTAVEAGDELLWVDDQSVLELRVRGLHGALRNRRPMTLIFARASATMTAFWEQEEAAATVQEWWRWTRLKKLFGTETRKAVLDMAASLLEDDEDAEDGEEGTLDEGEMSV